MHVNGVYPLFSDVATFVAWENRIPVLLNYHFDPVSISSFLSPISSLYSKLAPFFINKADTIVATGASYVKSSPILASSSKNVQIIPNAVEDKFFEPRSSTQLAKLKSQLGFSEDDKIILFVGQLKQFKGIDTLITAFKKVSEKMRNVRLLIVGTGPEELFLRRLISQLDISSYVVFTGYVDDESLPFYYQLCNVYVLPSVSRIENFGITLLEAMASGKPVLVSDLPGPNDVVENGRNGFIFQRGCFNSLSMLLLKLLNDDKVSFMMGEKGRLMAANYTWEKVASRFLNVYEQISR